MHNKIIFLIGVSGSGKTTVGRELSKRTGLPFFDGDDFHSLRNKEKMEAGNPLTDEDRSDWLLRLNSLARHQSGQAGAIIACSALKEKYRKILSKGIVPPVHWIWLQGSFELFFERMRNRKEHFMPASLLQSQFDSWEEPSSALVINMGETSDPVAFIMKELML
ncbi:MAG TPA: gluconokinase [Chitinophagaceae bacterium]|nr:gluconokinase [Chitinophagaceae bacterium]